MAKKIRNTLFGVGVPFVLLATFIPSSTTIAAMIVLPKLTSPAALNAMGDEGNKLMHLTEDALNSLTHKDTDRKDK